MYVITLLLYILKDILEFVNAFESTDTAKACCMSIVIHLLRKMWLNFSNDYSVALDGASVEQVVRCFYPNLVESDLEKLSQEVLSGDAECKHSNAYSIKKLNKYFIISFRDCTEYWIAKVHSAMYKHFNKEKLSLADFAYIMYLYMPQVAPEQVNVRFREALKFADSLSSGDNELPTRTCSCMCSKSMLIVCSFVCRVQMVGTGHYCAATTKAVALVKIFIQMWILLQGLLYR